INVLFISTRHIMSNAIFFSHVFLDISVILCYIVASFCEVIYSSFVIFIRNLITIYHFLNISLFSLMIDYITVNCFLRNISLYIIFKSSTFKELIFLLLVNVILKGLLVTQVYISFILLTIYKFYILSISTF